MSRITRSGLTRILSYAALFLAPLSGTIVDAGRASASTSSPPPVPVAALPPELQALEQKTLQLQLTSERFLLTENLTGTGTSGGPLGGLIASTAGSFELVGVTGEESFVPQEASFQASFIGLKSNGRLIGTTLYLEEPFIAPEDGGRPWVEEPNQHLEQAIGVELGALGGSAGSAAAQQFGKLIEALNQARSIRQLAPTSIDGQLATPFGASVELRKLATLSAAKKRALLKLFEPLVHLEVFFAGDGLPVRTRLAVVFRPHRGEPRSELIAQSEVLAVNIPVAPVQAPPADKTISESRLEKLLKRKLSKRKDHGRIVSAPALPKSKQ